MHVDRSWRVKAAAILFSAALSACAGGSANREFVRDIEPLVGRADQSYFLDKYGDPDRKVTIDRETEIWEYTFGSESLSDYGACTTMATSNILRLTFKKGTLSSWQANARVR